MQPQQQLWVDDGERRRRPSGGRRSRDGPARPACQHFLRGGCRWGSACRFSHDPHDFAASALPFCDRQLVQTQANVNAAAAAAAAAAAPGNAAASTAASAAAEPWRFRVMSYNVLADCLAHEHAAELYVSAPRFSLEWGYRGTLIIREVLHHRPDVVCLQEVDHFMQFVEALQPHGYDGMYTQRTGDRRDGLAMFWRADVMQPVKEQVIKFCQLGLKDNVAQLVAFQRRTPGRGSGTDGGGACSQTSSEGSAGSLGRQKRRQAERASGAGSATSGARHLRFNSGSESEGEGIGSGAKRRGSVHSTASAATAAAQAAPIEDAVGCSTAAGVSLGMAGLSEECAVEDATQPAEAEAEAGLAATQPSLPALVVANIHVLFNPRRGDMKLGQARTLLEHVDSLCLQQGKRSGQRAAAVICGDFNTAAGSPIYEFVRSGLLELPPHDRKRMSGQVEQSGHNWRGLQQACLARQQQQQYQQQQQQYQQQQREGNGHSAWPGQPPELLVEAAAAVLVGGGSSSGSHQQQWQHQHLQQQQQWQQPPVPPYAPPEPYYSGGGHSRKAPRPWSAEDVRLAAGAGAAGGRGVPTARHPMHLDSAYSAVLGQEAEYSTCHDKFIGCVDYIWFTPGGSCDASPWRLLPVAVLAPPPLQTLHCALPSPAWPSDHVSLVCDYVLCPAPAQQAQPGQRKTGKGTVHAHL